MRDASAIVGVEPSQLSLLGSGQNNGSIQRTVTDQSGAVIPNSRIVLRAAETGMPVQETRADRNGHFVLADVAPGAYEMEVSPPKFQKLAQQVRVSDDRDVMLSRHPPEGFGTTTVCWAVRRT